MCQHIIYAITRLEQLIAAGFRIKVGVVVKIMAESTTAPTAYRSNRSSGRCREIEKL